MLAGTLSGCREDLILPDTQADASVIVVEGDIVVGGAAENLFQLTRLRNLSQQTEIPVTNARVDILAGNGNTWPLTEKSPGKYATTASLPTNQTYALRITAGGKTYETPAQTPVITPQIDSVTWSQEPTSIRIAVHTRDAANQTRHYRWKHIETWESRAWYETYFDFVNGSIVTRPVGDQIYTCWKTAPSAAILISNSRSLDKDVISYQPVASLSKPSEKVYVRYSILVQQMGITREAYDFWDILRKNTELTGTLFDPQPANMPTNIRCTNDPKAKVIGYVSVGTITEKRLFILHSALDGWPNRNEILSCDAFEFSKTQAENFLRNNPNYLPAYFITAGGGFGVAPKGCIDCRLLGGTTVKPHFW
jgi:hypothetical protein